MGTVQSRAGSSAWRTCCTSTCGMPWTRLLTRNKIEERWTTLYNRATKAKKSIAPRRVAQTYMDERNITWETIGDEMAWECFPCDITLDALLKEE